MIHITECLGSCSVTTRAGVGRRGGPAVPCATTSLNMQPMDAESHFRAPWKMNRRAGMITELRAELALIDRAIVALEKIESRKR